MRNLAYTIPSSCLFLIPYDQSYSICNISHATGSRTLRMLFILLGVLRVGLDCAFAFDVCVFFFFFARVCETAATVHVLFNEQQLQSLIFLFFFSQSVHIMHCSWTHKFHFSATFSLKMGPTVLFTHLKLFCYSIFQFSVSVFSFQLYPNRPLVYFSIFFLHCRQKVVNFS